jgi:tRNA(Ser,Leu) C12 N-acetylase TAN1
MACPLGVPWMVYEVLRAIRAHIYREQNLYRLLEHSMKFSSFKINDPTSFVVVATKRKPASESEGNRRAIQEASEDTQFSAFPGIRDNA